ncbi:uncharacterized protein [Aristolochia californica]|uniref:uncharacterized protein n=1 Tax=Aristolochia californica TaxID=171875 RepID=UPI0035DED654
MVTQEEFEPVPRICRLIMSVYEDDPEHPKFASEGGYGINSDWVVKRVNYDQTQGRSPPYLIYIDHDYREIVLAIRGLNFGAASDFKILLNNRKGLHMFDGGCGRSPPEGLQYQWMEDLNTLSSLAMPHQIMGLFGLKENQRKLWK